ncbi:MAG: restriction endonuclease subunit S [Thermodesulfobacteriota bacterium]
MKAAEWADVPLGDITIWQGGSAFSPVLQGRSAGDIPFYKVSDMNSPANGWSMTQANNYVDESDRNMISGGPKPKGSVVFPKVGAAIHTNKKRQLSRPAFIDNNMMAVWPIDPDRCLPEFLYAFFLNIDLSGLANAGPLPSINGSRLRELVVALPPPQEQRQLVTVFSGLRSSLELEGRLFSAAQDLKRAAMRELFTRGLRGEAQKETEIGLVPESWGVVPFSAVRQWLQYGISTRCSPEPQQYPVLRIPNIEPCRVNVSALKYCGLPDKEAEKYLLADGDLIFIRTNGVIERLGSCAVYSGQPERALFASYLIRARLNQDVDSRYIAFFFGSEVGTALVAGRATPAADGKYNLNTGTIDSLPLPLPPTLDEQREIVAILDALDRKIDLHRRKRAVLEELFKALLHKLMTGEIRVSDLDLSVLEPRCRPADSGPVGEKDDFGT